MMTNQWQQPVTPQLHVACHSQCHSDPRHILPLPLQYFHNIRLTPQEPRPHPDGYQVVSNELPVSVEYESFRPANLPAKSPRETENHMRQVRLLEVTYRDRLQRLAVDEALKQMKASQREFCRTRLNQLWLSRFLPELVQRVSHGEPIGAEIEKAWREGLPPGIRKIVWPLAISNSLRITPELFEILSQKALELRTLEKWATGQDALNPFPQTRHSSIRRAATGFNASSTSSLGLNDVLTRSSSIDCRSSNSDVNLYPSTPVERSDSLSVHPSDAYSAELSDQKKEEALIRASLSEIFKRSKYNRNNRESSLGCIALDLPRTFPQLKLFQEDPTDGSLNATLQRLLEGWVCYRPDVGYVQGMSFLAALLVLYLDQFPAFVCFCNLLSSPALLGLYKLDPEQVNKRYAIFDRLFEKENPRLFQYFRSLKFPREAYLLEWFLTLFAKSLSLEMASYIWDLLFLDGEVTLFVAAVAILNIVSDKILPQSTTKKRTSSGGKSFSHLRRPHSLYPYSFPTAFSNRSLQHSNEIHRPADRIEDSDEEKDEVTSHRAFDRVRHVLSNIRDHITDEGELLAMMTSIKSKITPEIRKEIRLIESIEFSPLCCPEDGG